VVQVAHEVVALAGQLLVQRGAAASSSSSLMLASTLGARPFSRSARASASASAAPSA
jgi:hypothetical protein